MKILALVNFTQNFKYSKNLSRLWSNVICIIVAGKSFQLHQHELVLRYYLTYLKYCIYYMTIHLFLGLFFLPSPMNEEDDVDEEKEDKADPKKIISQINFRISSCC